MTFGDWPDQDPVLQVSRDGVVLFDGPVDIGESVVWKQNHADCGPDQWEADGTATF